MAVYVISDTVPQDPQAWETYIAVAPASIARYGGRYLARGGHIETIEGSWTPTAIVIVEFPDADSVKQWYASPEYAEALKVRDKALRRNLIAVEGVAAQADDPTKLQSLVSKREPKAR